MSEYWQVEKTERPDGSCERFEIHIGGIIHVISLERGKALAQGILSLLGIEVAQLSAENEKLHEWISAVCESATAAEMWAYVHRYSPGD